MLVTQGHHVILHGRNPVKLENVEKTLPDLRMMDALTVSWQTCRT